MRTAPTPATAAPAKRLIVTADDFGMAVPVNEAVERGHRDGMLSAASLMVAGNAVADALARARTLPGLGVGLHLVLVDGRPILPPERVPALVEADGRLSKDVVGAGIRLFLSRTAQRQAEAEIRAQFEAFRRTGLPLDHVNGHHHFHMHPTVFRILLDLAPEFGVRAVRVPQEPFLPSWRATGSNPANRFWTRVFHLRRTAAMKEKLRRAGIRFNDHIFGLADTGHMRPEKARAFLSHLPDGVSEIYFHPMTRRWADADSYPPGYEGEAEFRALVDQEAQSLLAEMNLRPEPFAALQEASHG